MKAYMLVGIVLLPVLAAAAPNDCRVMETPERYEVLCTGDPASKSEPRQAEPVVAPVQGKHRPLPRHMDEERAMRTKMIAGQPPAGPDGPQGTGMESVTSKGEKPDAK